MSAQRKRSRANNPRALIALALLGALAAPLAAAAHTKEDEAACKPDVFRLCSAAIPNQTRIVACLERNKRHLSSACSRVLQRREAGARFAERADALGPLSEAGASLTAPARASRGRARRGSADTSARP